MESILTSIKKLLGIAEEYKHFDADLIMHINSAFMILNQLGVGPAEVFMIEDDLNTWDEFMQNNKNLEAVKTYVYMKVRYIFDPPTSSSVMQAMSGMIAELESRLNLAVD